MSVTKFLFKGDQKSRMQALADNLYAAGIIDYRDFAYGLAQFANNIGVAVEVSKPPSHMTEQDIINDMDELVRLFGYIIIDDKINLS